MKQLLVIIPSYNQAKFLEESIISVVAQGNSRIKLVVLDGGSTDGSVSIIKKYATHLHHWESRPDGGQAAAIQSGFKRFGCDYLCWLNSDDSWLKDTGLRIFSVLDRQSPPKWLIGGCIEVDESGAICKRLLPIAPGRRLSCDHLVRFGQDRIYQPSVVFSRDVYESVGGLNPTLQFAMDYDLFLRFAEKSEAFVETKFLSCFRRHSSAKTTLLTATHDREVIQIRRRFGSVANYKPRRRTRIHLQLLKLTWLALYPKAVIEIARQRNMMQKFRQTSNIIGSDT